MLTRRMIGTFRWAYLHSNRIVFATAADFVANTRPSGLLS
jgi:hypothetical protein